MNSAKAGGKSNSGRRSRIGSPVPIPDCLEQKSHADQVLVSSFQTALGWFGLLGNDGELISVFAGHPSLTSLQRSVKRADVPSKTSDWTPELRGLFQAYADGEMVDFSAVKIRLPSMTAFGHQVIAATRRLGYGETASYGELARRIGHHGAARAVGTVMKNNRFPILIPCHRVLAAGGKVGGYTSPAGIQLKLTLLSMEASVVGRSRDFDKRLFGHR